MPRTPTTRRRRLLARVAVATLTGLLVVSGIACSGDHDDGDETGTDPTAADTTTPPTTSPVTPEEEAKAVYLELVDVVYRLLTTNPDPDDPELARLATDPVLANFRDSLTSMRTENHIVQRGDRTSQEVLSTSLRDPTTAVLRVCSVGNDTRVDRDDGSVVSDGFSTRLLEVVVISLQGTWTVSEIGTVQVFEGEAECPE
jgi:hypothetical protein